MFAGTCEALVHAVNAWNNVISIHFVASMMTANTPGTVHA